MSDVAVVLKTISEKVGGDWAANALIENHEDSPIVEAYNEGVHAMAAQVCHYLNAIAQGKEIEEALKKVGGQ